MGDVGRERADDDMVLLHSMFSFAIAGPEQLDMEAHITTILSKDFPYHLLGLFPALNELIRLQALL